MNIILLSGGSGKRLWPLSNEIYSKQFIKIFKKNDGSFESMIQRMYNQIINVDPASIVTIATSKKQVSILRNQLNNDISISAEPFQRDTFPAIILAAEYLKEKKNVADTESVVVCPVDPYVSSDYFAALKKMEIQVGKGESNIVLMGIEPTYPSEKYGYIIPTSLNYTSFVSSFREKPSSSEAVNYIESGALWNGGVFAFKISYIIKKAHEIIDYIGYDDLLNKYASLPKISFDYAILEKEKNIQVQRFNGSWKDIGTWNTLTESIPNNIIGNAIIDNTSKNVHIINELNIPVLAMGLNDVVICASPNGVLVSDKEQSSYIKPYVDKLNKQVMFAEKSWGSFTIIDDEDKSLTIKVTLNPGCRMNYHCHRRRNEVWVVIEGNGEAVVNDVFKEVKTGDVIVMKANCKHMIKAKSLLKIIEIQMGENIEASDKIKFPLV